VAPGANGLVDRLRRLGDFGHSNVRLMCGEDQNLRAF